MITAYFVGGTQDLTKRIMERFVPQHRFAKMGSLPLMPLHENVMPPEQVVRMDTETYVCIYKDDTKAIYEIYER